MKISPLFGDGMVLQRGQDNMLWGYETPETCLTISFLEKRFSVKVNQQGYFKTFLPMASAVAGGPHCLQIIGTESMIISDIMIGDVFLLGGQSNMELPIGRTLDLFGEEIKDTKEPLIRLFEVPKEYIFGEKREELRGGKWIQAMGKDLMNFSAVGFFTAKELRKTQNVPIGLLQTAVGGTPVKAWCSEERLQTMQLYKDELKLCKNNDYIEQIIKQETAREVRWMWEAKEGFISPSRQENTIIVPGMWEKTELERFQGSILLEKEVVLSKEQSVEKANIVVGTIVDADCIRINGIIVGETGYRYPPRRYEIPSGVLKAGINTIRIELLVFRGGGGFVPSKRYEIEWEEKRWKAISLEGEWNYRIGRAMGELPEKTFFQYMAAGMYQGMIYPLRNYAIKAFLYYQGESNTDHPKGYGEQLTGMIKDWRTLWDNESLPFLYVQLPGFSEGKKHCIGDKWAVLREEQRSVLNTLPKTAMVVIHDVGEYNDLHPQDKKTVGNRLSWAIRGVVYGENVVYSGPLYERMELINHGIRIYFTQIGSGFWASEHTGFELCGEDGVFVKANFKVEETAIFVWAEEITRPKGVRYGWKDDPRDACLRNQEGFLVAPFWAME